MAKGQIFCCQLLWSSVQLRRNAALSFHTIGGWISTRLGRNVTLTSPYIIEHRIRILRLKRSGSGETLRTLKLIEFQPSLT